MKCNLMPAKGVEEYCNCHPCPLGTWKFLHIHRETLPLFKMQFFQMEAFFSTFSLLTHIWKPALWQWSFQMCAFPPNFKRLFSSTCTPHSISQGLVSPHASFFGFLFVSYKATCHSNILHTPSLHHHWWCFSFL